MNRRELLQKSATFGLLAAVPALGRFSSGSNLPAATEGATTPQSNLNLLKPAAEGKMPVAFLISEGAVVIDFAGPWEVFSSVMMNGRANSFRLYTVAETLAPIRASGGLRIVPDHTLESAPQPKVIVIPAQSEPSEAVLDWIRKSSKTADVTMSVCTGAFVLAQTGLLAGKSATTHHAAYADLETQFPDIHVKRGVRFVEEGNLASSGGLSCGIDLALRVVERYFGSSAAEEVAYNMEYQGQGWMNPNSNAIYATVRTSTDNHPLCVVCGMDVDTVNSPKSVYKGKTYYFCSADHKTLFDAAPAKFVAAGK
jgi:transcriptional regulator GlxA family with amidase domain/YHS domain-containing protein